MSCTFWNMRRRNAAKGKAEPKQLEIAQQTAGAFTEIADGPAEAPKKTKKSKVKSNE